MAKQYKFGGEVVAYGSKVLAFDPNLPLESQTEPTCWVNLSIWVRGDEELAKYGITCEEVPDPQPSFEDAKIAKQAELDAWWDALPPIEVKPGLRLPIDLVHMSANDLAIKRAIEYGDPNAIVIDADEISQAVPLTEVPALVAKFKAGYEPLSQQWDVWKKAILVATTVEEIAAIIISK